MSCVFCAIIEDRAPAHVVYQDAATMAFLDIAPAGAGHTLVVPKVHATDLFDLSADDGAAVFRTSQLVARLLVERLAAEGLTVFQANGAAGWQDVLHFHVHLVPRWTGDSLTRPWRSTPADPTELADLAHRIGDVS